MNELLYETIVRIHASRFGSDLYTLNERIYTYIGKDYTIRTLGYDFSQSYLVKHAILKFFIHIISYY